MTFPFEKAQPASSWLLKLALAASVLMASANAAAREYRFDRVHSQVSFEVSHLGFSMSQGRFKGIDGSFEFDPKHWDRARCEVTIDIASLDMGDAAWTKKLLGKDWFNAAQHPAMRFLCTGLSQVDDRHGQLSGTLSLLGVDQPVVLELTFNKIGMDKYALRQAVGFSASTQLRRSQFGMARFIPDIGDDVSIRIEIEAFRSKK